MYDGTFTLNIMQKGAIIKRHLITWRQTILQVVWAVKHLADQMIKIDLDDGVKRNYALFQDVLANIK